ncbi:MAG: hypothetical protein HYT39_03205 [Candidatus Sungbacteria bacterium]|nr:hypothetical protein [Candidatus Sungbacteria bacterium]
MKATLIEFPYSVDTGDECKGPRRHTVKCGAILFEDGEHKVLFLQGTYDRQGAFFHVTEMEDGRPKLEGHLWDYRAPDGPVTSIRELPFTEDQIRAALAMPEKQELLQNIARSIKEIAKLCGETVPRMSY